MRSECFVLYAFNGEVKLPVAKVLVLPEDVAVFQGRMVEWVVECVHTRCPCLLAPFGEGCEFSLDTEASAVLKGEKLDYLPVVDLRL